MQITVVESLPQPMLFIRRRCSMDMVEIARQVEAAFAELGRFLADHHVAPVAPPLTVYSDWTATETTIEVGFPVTAADLAKAEGQVLAGQTPGGVALRTIHRGPYPELSATYRAFEHEMGRLGIPMGSRCWEIYPLDPETTPPADLITEIHIEIAPADAAKVPGAGQGDVVHAA